MDRSNYEEYFRDNRNTFGELKIDRELVDQLRNPKHTRNQWITKYYSSLVLDDLKVLVQIIGENESKKIRNKYDSYSLFELSKLNEIKFPKSEDTVVIGYVTTIDGEKYKDRLILLNESINSLKLLEHQNYKILVFANNFDISISADLIEGVAPQLRSKLFILTDKDKKGLSYGRNRIVDYAKEIKASSILFLDDDTYITDKYMINNLLYILNTTPHVAFIGPEITYKGSRIMSNGMNFIIDVRKPYNNETHCAKQTDFIEGSCHMVRTNLVGNNSLLGYYPEHYNCYWEEVLIQWRANRLYGLGNFVVKNCRFVHIRQGGGFLNNSSIYLFSRNFVYLLKDIWTTNEISFSELLRSLARFYQFMRYMHKRFMGIGFYFNLCKGLLFGVLYFILTPKRVET